MLPKFIFQKENLVEKPWGGEWIATIKGFKGRFAESWEFSAHQSNPSEVFIKGKTVSMLELISKFREELFGKAKPEFPLIKFLDVSGRMPIQVHPSDEVAQSLGESDRGKDKMWITLSSGKVFAGFKKSVNLEELKVKFEKIVELMNSFESRFLDIYMINSGIIHSAESIKLLEISTNSNLTYTIENDVALKALNTKKSEENEIKLGRREKVEMKNFGIEILSVSGTKNFEIRSFNVLICIEGFALLKSEEIVELHKGYSCLVPAMTKNYSIISDHAKIVRVYPLT
ncbi:MAG: hypothetical protein NZ895_03085 [Archaeoglobaceae archaeon]|nr:hypothetical protein [Archaeoglobaceae archaeon]MCX8152137.1 hypothetical protein [Archaeoglobaceae archaeon]MDW8013573.1 hypothetical protein [Archaeoglobaceae archaeon]